MAQWDTGSITDVTPWAVFQTDDVSLLRLEPTGTAQMLRPGRAVVLVRYLDHIQAVRLVMPYAKGPRRPLPQTSAERLHRIDDFINDMLATMHVEPAPVCSDAVFVRRIYLDLVGALPTPAESRAFRESNDPKKRALLIDRLLADPRFVDFWSGKLADLLRVDSKRLGTAAATRYLAWLRQELAAGGRLDDMARQLVLAEGDSAEVGPANFSRVPRNAGEHAELFAEVFLGVRLQCANCHDHPFDRWTQDDYHGLAAIFAKVARGPTVRLQPRGEVIHPRTKRPARAKLPGGKWLDETADSRPALVDWLVDPQNPYFARAWVNRLWRELMGRGLVEPVDDHRATHPPSHPELLEWLSRQWANEGFDLRQPLRWVANSAAYQRAPRDAGSATAPWLFAAAQPRPLPAAVYLDAIAQVTGVESTFAGAPGVRRAVELPDARVPSTALDLLGRCSRETSCGPATTQGAGLAAALHWINNHVVNRRLEDPASRLSMLLADDRRTTSEIIRTFYEWAWAREPSSEELQMWERELGPRPGRPFATTDDAEHLQAYRQRLQDFVWALVASNRFRENH